MAKVQVKGREIEFVNILDYISEGEIRKKPYSIRVLIENVASHLNSEGMEDKFLDLLVNWGKSNSSEEIGFKPYRVILQDFTGVPIVVDLAAMMDKVKELGGNPKKVNPKVPVTLVVDHSLQVDFFGTSDALVKNMKKEFERNCERYRLLKWAQKSFDNFNVVPPGKGIIHQVNLEYLSNVVVIENGKAVYETLVGTDSHTTMINGLGVLGWGVGGIEAEAVMLGQPYFMKLPDVVGVNLKGKPRDGVTATDIVLSVTNVLRNVGVVDKFVEFFGEGVDRMDVETRATIANMAPEYGATMGFFAVSNETLDYLYKTGRSEFTVELVDEYTKQQMLFVNDFVKDYENVEFSQVVEIDLSRVEPSLAGPRRPQDRVSLTSVSESFKSYLEKLQVKETNNEGKLKDGDIVIASITSCTNTSNPYVLIGAGLVAKKAVEIGLKAKPHVKTSFIPGSRVVTKYMGKSGLQKYLDELGFNIVGYGCATCIGNSGPLIDWVEEEIKSKGIVAVSVLSGNRNFEARVHPLVKANYLASPILVVAYAIAGNIMVGPKSVVGVDNKGKEVLFEELLPTDEEIRHYMSDLINRGEFIKAYEEVFEGTEEWKSIEVSSSDLFDWDESSTYIKKPPYFDNFTTSQSSIKPIEGARCLLLLGDSITTDHISPAGKIDPSSPAGKYLIERGVRVEDFNSYGARRGNHEVMMRGTFANVRLRNLMVSKEGGYTLCFLDNPPSEATVFDAAMRYITSGVPTIIIAGSEYGTGSSRDWAAKGPYLLGVKAVIAKSFERIHRSNLIGMGIIPLQFVDCDKDSLGITGREIFNIKLSDNLKPKDIVKIEMMKENGEKVAFKVLCRIDTWNELNIIKSGGIMQKVLRELLQ
jgi:aconitate hydratase